MAYYYYYNGYNSFFLFFLFFLFFILLLLILFPNYTKKDIVPPLSDNNYKIQNTIGTYNLSNTELTNFEDLIILDGAEGDNDAIDFGASEGDKTEVSYIPYYSESHENMLGYFQLNIGTSFKNYLAFRVVDKNPFPAPGTLGDYNYGWAALSTERVSSSSNSKPIYPVIIPFNLPGYTNFNHRLVVQIAAHSGTTSDLELSSAYLYYYSN